MIEVPFPRSYTAASSLSLLPIIRFGSINFVLLVFKIMDDQPEISPEDLYQELESKYKKINQ